jgi:hypothetical protein
MKTYATAEQHRRAANRLTLLVIAIVVASVLGVIFLIPSDTNAASYVHLDACKSSLRGGGGSDNDVNLAGVRSGATRFGGWSSAYTRVSATDIRVKGLLVYPGGYYLWWTGRCYDHDFGPDWFS